MENIFVVLKKALRSPKIVCHLKHSSSSEAIDLLCSLYNFVQIYYIITAVFMLFQCQQFYYKPPFLHTSVITQLENLGKTWFCTSILFSKACLLYPLSALQSVAGGSAWGWLAERSESVLVERKPRSALVLERPMAGVWCMSCAGFWAPTRFGVPCSTSVLWDGSACAPRRQSLWSWLPCRAGFDEIPSFILSLSHYGFPNRGWLMLRAGAKLPDPVWISVWDPSLLCSLRLGKRSDASRWIIRTVVLCDSVKLVLGEKVLLTSASLSGWVWLKPLALFLPSVKSHIHNFFSPFFFFFPCIWVLVLEIDSNWNLI